MRPAVLTLCVAAVLTCTGGALGSAGAAQERTHACAFVEIPGVNHGGGCEWSRNGGVYCKRPGAGIAAYPGGD